MKLTTIMSLQLKLIIAISNAFEMPDNTDKSEKKKCTSTMEKNSHGGENRVESDNEKEQAENSFFYNLI